MKPNLKFNQTAQIIIGFAVFSLAAMGRAQSTFVVNNSSSAAFMASGSPANPAGSDLSTNNYGNAGTLAIAPASSTKGAFDSLLLFNTSAAVTQFNTLYGAGGWTITGAKLSLASNFGVQGVQPNNMMFNTINAGSFGINLLADNNWVAGNGGGSGTPGYPANNYVDYAYIPTLLSFGYDSLGDFTYTPPGNNVYLNYTLPTDASLDTAAAGGAVSLFFYAADNQVSYLFNSQVFSSNHPQLTLTATPVPEPGTLPLLTVAFSGFLIKRRKKS
ncbi:MAG TPA: PEP-CTERM sorting domain-containing protein [Pseudomonadales bacterium]|nr:PEP-CTERM sorting domain-containing protein [Pseudomonadales bacterium]